MQENEILLLLRNPKSRERGFRLLIPQYKERLYWHVRRMVEIHEDADDLVQQTFVKVFRNIDKFKGDSKLYTWIYRIATNECITHLEKRKRRQTSTLEHNNAISINDSSSGEEILNMLHSAVKKLPAVQKAVFCMRYFDDLSYKEISQVLETSEGALKASYHHAAKKIKEEIKKTQIF